MRKLGPLRPLIAGRPTFKSYVFHQPGYYQPVQVFGINWGSCAVVRAAFHESGANVSVVRVVDGRHFRPTGLAPDEPCQEVEILNFLRHFLSVHWDLVQMKLYSLSAVCFFPVESGCPVRLNSIRQLSETWLSPGLPAGSPYSGFLTLLASLLELRKFSFYLECVVYGNPRARTEYDPGNWQSERADSIHRRSFPQAVTATRIAKALAPNDVEIDDKDSESITEPSGRAGRGGTAFGSALHAVLQGAVEQMSLKLPLPCDVLVDDLLADLDPAIEQLAQQHAKDQGVSASSDDVARLANRALRSPAVVAGMRAPRLWPEIAVAASIDTPRGPVVIEGIIDLLYQDDDGQLVILDYKSDRVDDNAAADAKLEHYRMQVVAYAAAVESATGNTVKAVQFLFVQLQDGLREIDNLRDSIDGIAQTIVHGMG